MPHPSCRSRRSPANHVGSRRIHVENPELIPASVLISKTFATKTIKGFITSPSVITFPFLEPWDGAIALPTILSSHYLLCDKEFSPASPTFPVYKPSTSASINQVVTYTPYKSFETQFDRERLSCHQAAHRRRHGASRQPVSRRIEHVFLEYDVRGRRDLGCHKE